MEFIPRGTLTISNSKDVSVSQKPLTQDEILSLKVIIQSFVIAINFNC